MFLGLKKLTNDLKAQAEIDNRVKSSGLELESN